MFDKKFKIVLFLGIAIILLIIFRNDIVNKIGSVEKISTFTESKSLTYYKKSCEYKDSDVCNELGDIYHYGSELASVDYEEAVKYYRLSCELRNGKGCNNLAYMYNNAKGLKHNNWHAVRLYKQACKYKEMEACYNLGSMYYNAEGVTRNYAKAAHYFEVSCNDNSDVRIGAGCNNLGYMHQYGKYFAKNIRKALAYYMKACDRLQDASACNNIANIHEKRGNLATARQYYEKACDLDDSYACNKLEDVLRHKITSIKEESLEQAINACNRASKGGTMCYRVGLYYEKEDEGKKARAYFEKACQRKQSQSCKHLGDLYR